MLINRSLLGPTWSPPPHPLPRDGNAPSCWVTSPSQMTLVQTWRSGLGGQVIESLGQALLLPADIEHYSSCWDKDLVLKLKWHSIVVSIPPTFSHPSSIIFILFYLFCLSVSSQLVLILWLHLLLFQAAQLTHIMKSPLVSHR